MNRADSPIVRVSGLKTRFTVDDGFLGRGRKFINAVDGIDLVLQRGRTLALVGESGSGKTTVALSLLRLIEPHQGEIWFDDVDLLSLARSSLRSYRRALQIVLQDPLTSLDPALTVREIIAEGMHAFRLYPDARQREMRISELLRLVRLDPSLKSRYPAELSGGQRQRVGIARALAVGPSVLVCDEPLSALDVAAQGQILDLLRELQREFALTYLFITHNLPVARHIADRVAVMYLGQIIEEGPAEQVFRDPRHPYTQALLAAAPSVDPSRRKRVSVLARGEIPSSLDPLTGCRYHTRCPHAFERCRLESPPMYEAGGSLARCFLHDAS